MANESTRSFTCKVGPKTFCFTWECARKRHEQVRRATGTNTSEQSAKLSRSSSCSPGSSSRPIYDSRKKKYRSERRLISRHGAFQLAAIPGDRGSFALNSLETSDRTFAELERHIMSISLFARFSSDKRQSRAVDCLRRLANRRDSHWGCKNVTTSHNNFILSIFFHIF